jgi:hypothetical protein
VVVAARRRCDAQERRGVEEDGGKPLHLGLLSNAARTRTLS